LDLFPGAPHGGVGNGDDEGERITIIKGENYVLYHNEYISVIRQSAGIPR